MKLPRPLAGLVLGHFSIDFWQGALADRHGAAAVLGGLAWVPITAMLVVAQLPPSRPKSAQ